MNKIDCDIINDLLPLYVEDITSDITKKTVDEHINSCKLCRENLESMKKEIHIPIENDKKTFEKIRKKLIKNKVIKVLLAINIVFILIMLIDMNLTSPIQINYNDDIIKLKQNNNGSISITMNDDVDKYEIMTSSSDNESAEYTIFCWQTKWDRLFTEHKEKTVTINKDGSQIVNKIYYFYDDYSGENVNEVYNVQNENNNLKSTTISTNKTNKYYLYKYYLYKYYFAAVVPLVLICIVALIIFRKKDKRGILLKIALVPSTYIVSALVVLYGKKDIYNVEFYFSRIMFMTMIMYIMLYLIIRIRHNKRIK